MKVKSESGVPQSCRTLCDPMDCSLPGSSIHGFFRQECWSGVPSPFLGQAGCPLRPASLSPRPATVAESSGSTRGHVVGGSWSQSGALGRPRALPRSAFEILSVPPPGSLPSTLAQDLCLPSAQRVCCLQQSEKAQTFLEQLPRAGWRRQPWTGGCPA